jgi:hypothetical protein
MRITFLGWLAILAVVAGVLLILQSRDPAPSSNPPGKEGVQSGED